MNNLGKSEHDNTMSANEDSSCLPTSNLVLIRGAGDIATGVAVRLHNCGYKVIMTDISLPTMIRCTVSFGQCLYGKAQKVEGITAVAAPNSESAFNVLSENKIPVLIDNDGQVIKQLQPHYVVDAILAKRNLGTEKKMAAITIALGPGFDAGKDCHAVIETNRGHHLGRVIYKGFSQANTGIPGNIAGYTHERVLRAPCDGVMQSMVKISDIVKQNDLIAQVDNSPVYAPLSGMVRGLLNDGLNVTKGFKIADIDPRGLNADYTTVSDKARSIGGSVLEAMLHLSLPSDEPKA
ncbi:MAG: selenium-dependent molybdenum cofactor biosynthesis protein YqeB [Colwellia sp.]